MTTGHAHIDTERMQALLDGELSPGEAAELRASIASCPRCTAELEGWQLLFRDLGALPPVTPSPTFGERVFDHLPEPRRGGVAGWLGGRAAARAAAIHIDDGTLQEYLDGRLPRQTELRVDRHLDRCAICRSELAGHRVLARSLSGLPHFTPTDGFIERVMAELRIRQMVEVAMAPTTRWGRVIGWLRVHRPTSRQGWAAAMGVALAPVSILLLLLGELSSHELVTPGSLLSWLRIRGTGWTDEALRGIATVLTEVVPGGLVESVGWIASNPTALTGTVALGLLGSIASGWVLYQNLIRPASREPDRAQLSF